MIMGNMHFNRQTLLIVGTDTGVGKTVLTAALATYWQTYRPEATVAVYKPLQSGVGDREYFQQTLQLHQALAEITPLYFETPIAPAIAAIKEGKAIDLGLIWQQFQDLQTKSDFLLVESFGGLGSPLTAEYIVADLARDWQMPTVLVVPVRLGAISQAVANVALATMQKVNLKGLVLNNYQSLSEQELEDLAPSDLIQNLTGVTILGILPHLADLQDRAKLAQAASGLELEKLGW